MSGCWWFSYLTLLPHPLLWVMDLLVFHSFFHSFSDWWAPCVPGIVPGIGIQSWTRHGIFLRKAGSSHVISEDTYYWEDTRCWQRDWVAWGLWEAQIWLSRLSAEVLCWPLCVLRVQSSSFEPFAAVASLFSCQVLPAPPLTWSASPNSTVCRAERQCLVSFASNFWVDFLFSVISPVLPYSLLLVLQVWPGMSALGHLSWHMQDWASKATSPHLSDPVRTTEVLCYLHCIIFVGSRHVRHI